MGSCVFIIVKAQCVVGIWVGEGLEDKFSMVSYVLDML